MSLWGKHILVTFLMQVITMIALIVVRSKDPTGFQQPRVGREERWPVKKASFRVSECSKGHSSINSNKKSDKVIFG